MRFGIRVSKIYASPVSACVMPRASLITVDFPEPDGPINPNNCPVGNCKLTWSSTVRAPYDFVIFWSAKIVVIRILRHSNLLDYTSEKIISKHFTQSQYCMTCHQLKKLK